MITESTLQLALFSIIQVLILSFVLWMIVDAAVKDRYLWMVLIIGSIVGLSMTGLPVLGILGAVIYMFLKKKDAYLMLTCKHCKNGVCTNHK